MDFFKSFFDSKSNLILFSLILLDVLLIILLIFFRNAITDSISTEGYKLLWQVAIITVGGGLISLAFAELKREQESRKATRDYFKTVFTRALKEYNKAKKCRRLLRANAIYKEDEEVYLRPDEYNKLMTELEDCQLEFESLKREMIQNKIDKKNAGPKEYTLLESYFEKMEEYLGNILSEFEEKKLSKDDKVNLSDMNILKEFIKSKGGVKEKKTMNFQNDFSIIFDKTTMTLIKEISK